MIKKTTFLIIFLFLTVVSYSQVTINDEDFEGGWGIWHDGGNRCTRENSSLLNNSWSIHLTDNSGVNSSFYTNVLDFTTYSSINISFDFRTNGFNKNNNEDFFIEISNDGGVNWDTLANYALTTDFVNNNNYNIDSDFGFITATNGSPVSFNSNMIIRIRCDASGTGDHLYIDNILIEGTSSSSGPVYCSSNGNNTNDEYISRVQLNTINNLSGDGVTSTGYSDFTALSTDLTLGSSNTITITPTWTGAPYNEGYSVWIDYNQDGDFSDSGEQVWTKDPSKSTPVSGSFTVPSSATIGTTRMRVSLKYEGVATSCESFNYGEVEDYTVNIISPCTNPAAPTSVTATPITICSGDNVNLNATSAGNTINWYTQASGGTSIGNSASGVNFVANPTSTTTYYAESDTGTGCVSATRVATAVVTVNPYPSAAGTISGTSNVCAGTSSISYSVPTIANANSYTWSYSGTGATISGGTTENITINFAASATSGTLTVYGTNSCGDGSTASFPITVNNTPAAAGTITGTTAVCGGTSGTSYSVPTIANAISYTWSYSGTGATISGTSENITIDFSPSATSGNLTVLGTNSGCGDGTVSANYAITVNPTPTITSTTPGSRTGAGTVNLSATASSGTISWFANSTGGSALGTGVNFTTPSISATTSYFVEVSNGTCTSPRLEVIATVLLPEINVQGNGNNIPDGFSTISNTYDTDFGSLEIGDTPVSHTFTIENTGTGILNISSITSSNGDFTISSIPTSVSNGSSTTFIVTYNPSAVGNISSTITIINDDSDESNYTFSVEGFATGPPPMYTAYYNNFDSSDDGWWVVTTTNDDWIRTNTFNNSTEMGEGYFWRNSNYNNYNSNTNIVIESPVYNFTGLENLLFSIDIKYNTQNNTDGMRILYSISGGTYTLLGSSSSGTNWYQGNVSALVSDGWSADGHDASPTFDPHSEFGRSSISLSDAVFSNVSNVRFRVEFSSDGSSNYDGVAFDNVLIEADPITPLSEAAIAPANITSNLRLWLKTNEGVAVSDGADLTNWEDQAYDTSLDKEDAYSSSALAPKYRDNSTRNMNFNPVADFDNNNTEYMQGKGGYFAQDYFVVFRSDDEVENQTGSFSPGRQIVLGGRFSDDAYHEDPTGLGMGSTSGRFDNEILSHNVSSYPLSGGPNETSYGRAYTSTSVTYKNHPLIVNVKSNVSGTSTEIYKNGKRVDNVTGKAGNGTDLNFNEFSNLQYLVGTGRSGITGRTTSQLNGMLTEVISYTSPNSAINQQKIQSYLGLKYGVTLQDDGSSLADYRLNDVDYIDSQGAVIWDTSDNSGYNYDIAGIGRDNASILNQKQSRSQNDESDVTGPTSGILTIGLGDIYDTNKSNPNSLNDRQFLIWGNNNASLDGSPLTVEPDMSADIGDPSLETKVLFEAIPRIWKVREVNGDIPKVEVSIPKSAVRTAVPPDGRYLMFISSSGIFDPTADYREMTEIGGNLYTHYDFDGTEYVTFGWAPEREFKRSIYFDPADTNYIDMEDALDLDPNGNGFTVSSWIKRQANSGNKSILSKRDAGYSEGYDFKINLSGKVEMSWGNNGVQKITSNTTIPINEWHQVAVIYKNGTANLYIDGVLDKTETSLTSPAATSQSFFIAAAGKNTPEAYFHGNIDEVRVWDTALSLDQLRYVMNQEIRENTTFVSGKVLPQTVSKNEVSSVPWSQLAGYYPMSVYTYTNTKDESGKGHQGALKNLRTVDWQTAPLPYVSTANTNWDTKSTWENGDVQTIPGAKSIIAPVADRDGDSDIDEDDRLTVDWNIVQISSNVIMNNTVLPSANNGNRNVLGLMVDNSKKLTAEGTKNMTDGSDTAGNGLTVTHYLSLDGKIDLEGGSQLIQTYNSDLVTSANGEIERDQQGTASSYNYNYWSSSVGAKAAASNNTNYTIAEVLKDGRTSTPESITFNTSYGAADGTGIPTKMVISTYWLRTFNGTNNTYSKWSSPLNPNTSTLEPGEGFTMKGVRGDAAITEYNNFTFVGRPNNGDISLNITQGNDRLIGNPYPSAIDANEFILDNISDGAGSNSKNIFNGALYFWHHFAKTNHNLADYVGGYAAYTLIGGTEAISNDTRINATGDLGGRKPERFIPVNQGFFVNTTIDAALTSITTIDGGDIQFKNSQRVFQLEGANSGDGSLFFKGSASKNAKTVSAKSNDDDRQKIRLLFNSPKGYHRQLLVGVDENTTNNFDIGYDAPIADVNKDDMFWTFNGAKFVIQGVNNFNKDQELPLGIVIEEAGLVSIQIDELENIEEDFELYIKDNLDGETYSINGKAFEIYLEPGEYLERFMLVFKPRLLSLEEVNLFEGIHTYMNNTTSQLQINKIVDTKIESVYLFNSLGQVIQIWNTNLEERLIFLPINASTGVYFLQITTSDGLINKKIIIE